MSVLVGNKWLCSICDKEYTRALDANICEKNHDIIYVPFFRGDLFKLWNFLMTRDESLLSGTLMQTLLKYKDKMVGQDDEAEGLY